MMKNQMKTKKTPDHFKILKNPKIRKRPVLGSFIV